MASKRARAVISSEKSKTPSMSERLSKQFGSFKFFLGSLAALGSTVRLLRPNGEASMGLDDQAMR